MMIKLWFGAAWIGMLMLLVGPFSSDLPAIIHGASAPVPAPTLAGCPVFPINNIWNTPVDSLSADENSDTYIDSIGAATGLHPDFGSGTWEGFPIGIPYNVVAGNQGKVFVTFKYANQSDPGPYPIPANPLIEGDPNGDGDRHILILDKDNCILYELFAAYKDSQGWHAGSGAIYDLRSNALRPDTWTSADAAGLPILSGLARYDEVAAGAINHALRFTVQNTRNAHVWPARHDASDLTQAQYPAMGMRLRLKASYLIPSNFSPQTRIVLQALKKYGMILADNGSNWYISGVPDPNWNNDALVGELAEVPGSAFEVVDVSPLMVNPDSGQTPNPSIGPNLLTLLIRLAPLPFWH
jgi:hypothetical protein